MLEIFFYFNKLKLMKNFMKKINKLIVHQLEFDLMKSIYPIRVGQHGNHFPMKKLLNNCHTLSRLKR